MAGTKEMLLRGDWPTQPPMGFNIVRENGKRMIVVNEKGKLLRQAFEWKAYEQLSTESVRAKLAKKGLKLSPKIMSKIFRNPFYCGLMVHKMLEGSVVEGNQEKLVSRETFLRVNGVLNENAQGYTINEENTKIPLKRFLSCDHCGKPMRGYIVKKKNIHYYKCNTKACNNNKNASVLNRTFSSILDVFRIDKAKAVVEMIKRQVHAAFNQLTANKQDDYQNLQAQHKEIISKINRLEERYIEEEIGGELYHKYRKRYDTEKAENRRETDEALPGGVEP